MTDATYVVAADLKRGDRVRNPDCSLGAARVMAIAEGWVMLRYKGAAPFLRYAKEMEGDQWLLISRE